MERMPPPTFTTFEGRFAGGRLPSGDGDSESVQIAGGDEAAGCWPDGWWTWRAAAASSSRSLLVSREISSSRLTRTCRFHVENKGSVGEWCGSAVWKRPVGGLRGEVMGQG